jgi:hypothetical protein
MQIVSYPRLSAASVPAPFFFGGHLSDYWRIRNTCPTTGGSAFFISAFYFFTKNRFT